MFSLFLNDLDSKLNETKLGIQIADVTVSAIFFADDIVLISKNKKGMNKLLAIVTNWTIAWKMHISLTKSKFMSNPAGSMEIPMLNTSNNNIESIKEIMFFKYLGVNVEIAPWQMYKKYNEHVLAKARNYMYAIISLSKDGPDRSEVARCLWLNCALPSILYGVECNILKKGTLDALERIQSRVGKFILQLPPKATNVTANLDAGLKPMKYQIIQRQLMYHARLLTLPASWWVRKAYSEQVSLGMSSKYMRVLTKTRIENGVLNANKRNIELKLQKNAEKHVFEEAKKCKKSSILMVEPTVQFQMKPWVEDTELSKTLLMFRGSDAGLGNRAPLPNGRKIKICELCKDLDTSPRLNNEVHLLTECVAMKETRDKTGMSNFINAVRRLKRGKSNIYVARLFLGHDGASTQELNRRANTLQILLADWKKKMSEIC